MKIFRLINCPTCEKELEWSDKNHFRPFCSERCKLIDFGEWATEQKKIAGEFIGSLEDDEKDTTQ